MAQQGEARSKGFCPEGAAACRCYAGWGLRAGEGWWGLEESGPPSYGFWEPPFSKGESPDEPDSDDPRGKV
jgi:hypothetical protein